jgi:hypothetical protein
MAKKRLSTMARLDMVITTHPQQGSLSEHGMVVTPQLTSYQLNTGLVRIFGLAPRVQRLHALRIESVRNNG